MPAKSGPQYRLMQAIAHGAKPYSGHGPSKAVAKEFVDATPKAKRKKWSHSRSRSMARKMMR